jgi:ribose transport system ATP-binding protein
MVEIAKALRYNVQVLIMDEPTSSLTNVEIDHLFEIMENLRQNGVGIIYVSHRMDELFRITDRVTVLKDGKRVGTVFTKETSHDQLVQMMVGRKWESGIHDLPDPRERIVLRAENVSNQKLQSVSFALREGEIVGIAGLVGAGRTELARALFGLEKASLKIEIDGQVITKQTPKKAINHGIALIPEDRKAQGIFGLRSVLSNLTISSMDELSRALFIKVGKRRAKAEQLISNLNIQPPNPHQLIQFLSGGNQQKVVIGKWIGANSRILIFDEPTRGVDVAAKAEIYHLMRELVAKGKSILMISSELPEILRMSHRILVMHEGKLVKELSREEATEEKILWYAMGGA